MYEHSQLNLFESEQDLKPSIVYRGASLASRTALQESVKRLVMNAISGRKCGASLAKLSRDGLWLKMSGDYCQAKMDGSFEEYSEILPTWGLMLDGVLIEPPISERFIPESGLRLLPTPVAMDGTGGSGKLENFNRKIANGQRGQMGILRTYLKVILQQDGDLNPNFSERVLGYEIGWTDLNHSETP